LLREEGLREVIAPCRRRAFSDPPRVWLCLGHSPATVGVTPKRRLQLSPCWIWWQRALGSHRRSLVALSAGRLRAPLREGSTAARSSERVHWRWPHGGATVVLSTTSLSSLSYHDREKEKWELGLPAMRTLSVFVASKSVRRCSVWMDGQRHFGLSFGPSGRRVWRPNISPKANGSLS
jgi:hypothetical protein